MLSIITIVLVGDPLPEPFATLVFATSGLRFAVGALLATQGLEQSASGAVLCNAGNAFMQGRKPYWRAHWP